MKVDTSSTSSYSFDIEVLSKDGVLSDQTSAVSYVNVVRQTADFEILDAVTTKYSVANDGHASVAIGHVLTARDSCIMPQPSGRGQNSKADFNIHQGYLTVRPDSYGFGPSCDNLVITRATRLV